MICKYITERNDPLQSLQLIVVIYRLLTRAIFPRLLISGAHTTSWSFMVARAFGTYMLVHPVCRVTFAIVRTKASPTSDSLAPRFIVLVVTIDIAIPCRLILFGWRAQSSYMWSAPVQPVQNHAWQERW